MSGTVSVQNQGCERYDLEADGEGISSARTVLSHSATVAVGRSSMVVAPYL